MTLDELTAQAHTAAEAIRALNHATIGRRPIPAPTAYDLLGDLCRLGHGLAQLANQLSNGLTQSLAAYDVHDHNRDPANSVALAGEALSAASRHASNLGDHLALAQAAINLQGYNTPQH
jgi:hypothetical protein